jgi:hypothetical protein
VAFEIFVFFVVEFRPIPDPRSPIPDPYRVRKSRTRLALNSVFGSVPGGTNSILGRTSQRDTISVSTTLISV